MYSILEYGSAKLFVPRLEGTPFCLVSYSASSLNYLAVCVKIDKTGVDVIPEMVTKEPIGFIYCSDGDRPMLERFELSISRNFGWVLHKDWGLLGGKYKCLVFTAPPDDIVIKLIDVLENLYKNNLWSR